MLQDQTRIELVCKSGHKSEHLLDRVLRHNDAWCSKCGADIQYNPEEGANKLPKAA